MYRPKSTIQFVLAIVVTACYCLVPTTASAQFGDIQMRMHGGGTSISVSNVNGVKTTKVNDRGKKYEITESEEEGIKVKFTKVYGPKDREQLKEDYPDLFMHVSSFPTETEGATVELDISIVREEVAQNAEALKKDHPDAFKIYEKYSQKGGAIRIRGGGFGGGIRIEDFDFPEVKRFGPKIEIDRIPRIEIEGFPPIEVEPKEKVEDPDDVDI